MKKIGLLVLILLYWQASVALTANQNISQFVDGNQRCEGDNCIPVSNLDSVNLPTETMPQFNDAALQCNDMACINNNLASIDQQIVTLIGKRLAFAKRAHQLKDTTQNGIANDSQLNRTLLQVMQQAEAVGYPRNVARVIFTAIIMQSNLFAGS